MRLLMKDEGIQLLENEGKYYIENENQMGEIEFDKEKKEFNILKQVNDLRVSNQAYEKWVSEQIIKIVFRNNGQFPDATSVEK